MGEDCCKDGKGGACKSGACVCGMHLCGKCAPVNLLFGLVFLVLGLGLWAAAPTWFNPWTVVGVYLALWGLTSMFMK
ncbi:MAG: hypothetical protein Q7S92_03985 [Candidatus Diapherotrites archaeon]|nr:hypothetical protein [Candidatus Diapherotrites archaeon]